MKDFKKFIGKRTQYNPIVLRDLKGKTTLTYKQIGKECNVTESYIKKIFNGERNCPPKLSSKIFKMLLKAAPYKDKKECLDILFKNWDKQPVEFYIRLGENLKKIKNTE